MHRLFVAIDLPPRVKEKMSSLCHGINGARWVSDSQMHLTLKFIGAVDDNLLLQIKARLSDVRLQEFTMSIRHTGCFPQERNARVIWAGVDAPPSLLLLHHDIDAALAREAIPVDERQFSPHITLARMKSPSVNDVRRFLAANADFSSPPFDVRAFHLYESTLGPAGPTYIKVSTYPLTTADRDTP